MSNLYSSNDKPATFVQDLLTQASYHFFGKTDIPDNLKMQNRTAVIERLSEKFGDEVKQLSQNPPVSLVRDIHFDWNGSALIYTVDLPNYANTGVNLGTFTVTWNGRNRPDVSGGNYNRSGSIHPHVRGSAFCMGQYGSHRIAAQSIVEEEIEPAIILIANILNTLGPGPYITLSRLIGQRRGLNRCYCCNSHLTDQDLVEQRGHRITLRTRSVRVCNSCLWRCEHCGSMKRHIDKKYPVFDNDNKTIKVCGPCFYMRNWSVNANINDGIGQIVKRSRVLINPGNRVTYSLRG